MNQIPDSEKWGCAKWFSKQSTECEKSQASNPTINLPEGGLVIGVGSGIWNVADFLKIDIHNYIISQKMMLITQAHFLAVHYSGVGCGNI